MSLQSTIVSIIVCNIGKLVNDSKAKLPYSKIEELGIRMEGLPDGKQLKHPSS